MRRYRADALQGLRHDLDDGASAVTWLLRQPGEIVLLAFSTICTVLLLVAYAVEVRRQR